MIETTYDLAGRATARAVTTLASGFDGAVRRIETAYDSHGRMETVTQYNAASSGSVVDQVKYIHDGWGNLTNFRQDLDSTVGGSGYWEVAYAYAKATGGRNTLRRTQTTLPGGEVFKFHYRTGTASHDDKYSRVTTVRDAEDTDLAGYQYNGAGQVVRTELSEVGIFSKSYNGSGTTFGRLDRFNRTLISSWTRDLATNRDIYKVTLGYDRNSNITSQDDAVHTGHDVAYANDDLNRLIDADEGTLSSGVIDSLTRKRRQQWTLNHTGNWNRDKVDLNGDADYLDAGELDDTRTHNAVNELTARDTNTSSPAEFSLTYDAAGNMTDDGVYKYEWDAFYRLRKVKSQSNALVSEYWYNGLGYLVTRHQDTDADGDVDGSDQKFHTAYDERWRQVATYRGSDANPKERFLYHWAGTGGRGGSFYIDSVVLRDRDMTNGWTGAADGTLEERVYYLQNWRADVVGLVDPDGSGGATMVEWVKYSAYGVPFGMPAKDADSDGDYDLADDAVIAGWGSYDVRGDVNLDGVVNGSDTATTQTLGRGVLTSTSIGNRKGYAGYEGDAKLSAKWHVRHRVLDSVLGRWFSMDPLGFADGANRLSYCGVSPVLSRDPSGLITTTRLKYTAWTCGNDDVHTPPGAPRPKTTFYNSGECGVRCPHKLSLEGDYKDVVSPTGERMNGIFIQKITYWVNQCECPESSDGYGGNPCFAQTYVFYESWKRVNGQSGSDTLGVKVPLYGAARKTVELRFYSPDHPNFGFVWQYYEGSFTAQSPPNLYGGFQEVAPHWSPTEPGWWGDPLPPTEVGDTREAFAQGECCPLFTPYCYVSCSP